MKSTLVTVLLSLSAATLSVAQPHNHIHRHHARHGSPVEARDAAVTKVVPGPTVTVYELAGMIIPWPEVEAGIASGKYILMGDKISTVLESSTTTTPTTSSTPSATPTPAPTSTTETAVFIQKVSTTSTSSYVAPTTSTIHTKAATTTAATPASSGGASNVNVPFPTNEADLPDCSVFPSAYGAVAASWLGLGDYTGIQQVTDTSFVFGVSAAIAGLSTVNSGGSCCPNSFCSYACPPGYQKSQWPSSQGSKGESIGGLYCNSKGKLELSRPSEQYICTAGVGGVQVKNSMSEDVAICRTDYPGTESETILSHALAGTVIPITNPDASTYYVWEGAYTSAQYYINPKGADPSVACVWGSAGSNLGNWAPVNMGVGKSSTGETFISIFPNVPTNPDGVLDFNIAITGDVSDTTCKYENGAFSYQNAASATGCTVSVKSGGTATFEFSS